MNKYLVLSDLDDTLLTSEKTITKKSIDYIRNFINMGNVFSICTGRPINTAKPYYDQIGSSGPFITDNGAAIRNLNGLNLYFEIPFNIWKSFLNKVNGMDKMFYMTTSSNYSYSHNRNLLPEWIISKEIDGFTIIEGNPYDICKISPLVCNFFVKKEYLNDLKNILDEFKKDIFSIIWGKFDDDCYNVELRSVNATKGNALKYLKKYYMIKDENTFAFGDQLNDIEMLKEAYYGVAMINAADTVKEISKYQSKYDFNNDGVIEFIKEIVK